jgi:RecA/RadA recombinase
MSLLAKLAKNSTIKESDILSDSSFFNDKDMVSTSVPALNIALAGDINGGFVPGLTQWCGPSKHFKTLFCLLMAKAYMDKYPESVLMFYDSEFGTPLSYFESVGIDMSRVLHTPLVNIELLKHDIMKQLECINRGDKVFIMIDSVGNLASKKEVEDALEGKSTADMTRAKQLKSMFRMVTPLLTMKDIPMHVVNHTYKTMELYSKDVVGGGTGSYYSSDNIYIIGRQQEKDGTELLGYNFIIKVEKSRHVKEQMKIPITVSFEGGLSRWSGLLEIAQETGHVIKPSNGWYSRVNKETGEVEQQKFRAKDTDTAAFWTPILGDETFKQAVRDMYQVSNGSILSDEEVVSAYKEAIED